MKKVLFVLLGISTLIASLSVAYYFVVFLPQKEKNYEVELKKIRREIQNTQNTQNNVNTSEIENRLEDIQSSMQEQIQEQERERQMQNDCESSGGRYSGSGVCILK